MKEKMKYFTYRVEKDGNAHVRECTTIKEEALLLRDSFKKAGHDAFVKNDRLEIVL